MKLPDPDFESFRSRLAEPLAELLETSGFPDGTFHLRAFRLRDHVVRDDSHLPQWVATAATLTAPAMSTGPGLAWTTPVSSKHNEKIARDLFTLILLVL